MRETFVVFKKELIDTLRDRRTIIAMVIMPLLLFPLLFFAATWIVKSQSEEAAQKTLTVTVLRGEQAPGFADRLAAAPGIDVERDVPEDSVQAFVRSGRLDAAFAFAPDFDERVQNLGAGGLELVYKSGDNSRILLRRLRQVTDAFEQEMLETRFAQLDVSLEATQTLRLQQVDVATTKEQIAQTVGGFLPYIFIIFCFAGGMYPAIDLGAGEKERGTLEALLTTPASRLQILIGKFSVIVLAGVLSAVIAIASIVGTLQLMEDIPQALVETAYDIISPGVVAVLLSLLVPLTIFFAAVQLSLSFYAKSFKEAQSIINPLTIAVIFPAFIGILPGIELNAWTAVIPVLNVSLATEAVIAGTLSTGLLLLIFASLITLGAAALVVCAQMFQRESIIFRT